jgi:glutamine phosphoribosylpyrophosphate amidotransferase
MCGIVGCVGTKDASTIVLDGLKKLEYRGYDSAGIASVDGDLDIRPSGWSYRHRPYSLGHARRAHRT